MQTQLSRSNAFNGCGRWVVDQSGCPSLLDRGGDGLGIERQLAECRRLYEQRGYTPVKVISDNNRSATSGERPSFEDLLRLIEQKSVDVVVVLRIHRLLRRLAELETFIELSERTGVPIATVEGDVDQSTPSGRLVGGLLASVAVPRSR